MNMKIVLNRVLLMMIALVWSCSKGWCQSDNDTIPLQGNADSTTMVSVGINYIKQANIKLYERKMLLELNAEKDTIIAFKDSYILEQERIIKDFQDKVNKGNDINKEISRNLERQKKITYIVGGVAGASIITTIVLIFAK